MVPREISFYSEDVVVIKRKGGGFLEGKMQEKGFPPLQEIGYMIYLCTKMDGVACDRPHSGPKSFIRNSQRPFGGDLFDSSRIMDLNL